MQINFWIVWDSCILLRLTKAKFQQLHLPSSSMYLVPITSTNCTLNISFSSVETNVMITAKTVNVFAGIWSYSSERKCLSSCLIHAYRQQGEQTTPIGLSHEEPVWLLWPSCLHRAHGHKAFSVCQWWHALSFWWQTQKYPLIWWYRAESMAGVDLLLPFCPSPLHSAQAYSSALSFSSVSC